MSKRKAMIDLSERLFKVQKSRDVPEVSHRREKRRRPCEIHYPSVKQRIRSPSPILMTDIEQPYLCSLHDNDRDVCLIYDCSGGRSFTENLYNYIN